MTHAQPAAQIGIDRPADQGWIFTGARVIHIWPGQGWIFLFPKNVKTPMFLKYNLRAIHMQLHCQLFQRGSLLQTPHTHA